MDFESLLESYIKMKNVVDERLIILQQEHSNCDKKIVDIEHEIEFGNYDTFSMVKVFKDLKETLEKRRILKTEISKFQQLRIIFKEYKQITKSCKGFDNRKYKPRILNLDFSNPKSLLKSRKIL